jgi:hypothetical protein
VDEDEEEDVDDEEEDDDEGEATADCHRKELLTKRRRATVSRTKPEATPSKQSDLNAGTNAITSASEEFSTSLLLAVASTLLPQFSCALVPDLSGTSKGGLFPVAELTAEPLVAVPLAAA